MNTERYKLYQKELDRLLVNEQRLETRLRFYLGAAATGWAIVVLLILSN